uniref:Protein YIF1 n=1 Tax=Gasterosteus aculeatus aculeatus TaxID=481459 RepID=G3PY35_GASAC
MDLPHQGYRANKPRARAAPPTADSILFDDTSSAALNNQGYYTPAYNMAGPSNDMQGGAVPNNVFADPMANAAMMYGSSIANQGKDMVNKEISRFMSVNKLKYFFAVDTRYVLKKLMILMFPYTHQDWEVRYHRDAPLTPRQDVNAPDLYIPTMAFITYILLAGMALGIQKRMIFTVLCGLLFGSDGYYVALAWSSCALMFFIVRSLKMKILPSLSSDSIGTGPSAKHQFRLYITVATALFQPIVIYWLTSHLVR